MTEEERRAIEWDVTRLIHQYVNIGDAQEWEAVAALFTQEGSLRRPSGGEPIRGREAILAAFKSRPPRALRHVVANIVVDVINPSEATAFSVILLFFGDLAADGLLPKLAPGTPLVGSFVDQVVKTNEGWRFASREGALDFRS